MSDWIAIEIDLPDHPKVRDMARTLGIDRDTVIGKLVRVWGWFDHVSPNGFVAHTVDADIDDLARHNGFARAMADVGWLTLDHQRKRVGLPKFDNHNGNSTKKRLQTAERVRRHRQRKTCAADGNAEALQSNAPSVAGSALHVPQKVTPTPHHTTKEQKLSPSANAPGEVAEPQFGDLLGDPPKPPKKQAVPVQAIVDLYHQVLPELPRVFKLTTARREQITARWREDLTDMDDWQEYFTRVRSSRFLMGLEPPGPDRDKPFIADLEFLTRASIFARFNEGKYHGKLQGKGAGR